MNYCLNGADEYITVKAWYNQMNILIVDDDAGIRDSLDGFLKSEGHQCQTARNGVEALKILERYTPNAIIADIDMPNMSGIELFNHIRSDHPGERIGMLLITGGDYDNDCEFAGTDNEFTVIKKPIHPSEIRKFLSPA